MPAKSREINPISWIKPEAFAPLPIFRSSSCFIEKRSFTFKCRWWVIHKFLPGCVCCCQGYNTSLEFLFCTEAAHHSWVDILELCTTLYSVMLKRKYFTTAERLYSKYMIYNLFLICTVMSFQLLQFACFTFSIIVVTIFTPLAIWQHFYF